MIERKRTGKQKSSLDKLLEKIPPFTGFFILFSIIFFSYILPEIAAIQIIVIDVYFLYKSITYTLQFGLAMIRIRHHDQINWLEKVKGLEDIPNEIIQLKKQKSFIQKCNYSTHDLNTVPQSLYTPDKLLFSNIRLPKLFQKLLFTITKQKTIRFLRDEIKFLETLMEKKIIKPSEIQHIVIIPHVKEPYLLLKETLRHLACQTFPTKQISIVLAAEAVDPDGVKISRKLKEEFNKYFNHIWITNHVLGQDEIVGKSSNMAWAGKAVSREIIRLGWDLAKTTVTSCDADSKLPVHYFAYLTYKYLTIEDAKYKFFNGAMVLYNNIWRLPFYARIKNSMSTIYNVGRQVRTDKLVPFSTYSTSFWLVDKIGYWTPWITPEDFHIFFKSLFKFNNYVETIPLYLKIMSDAAEGSTHWETFKNNYMQERRWAWGISDDGWILKNILLKWKKLSLRVKYIGFHVIWDHISGSIGALVVLIGGNIPPLLNLEFRNTVFGVRLPGVSSSIIQLTIIFMVIVIFIDFFLKPRPAKNSWWKKIIRIIEWIVQPFTGFFLTIVPGLEAHTRLLFGDYLEYYVTKKKVQKEK